MYAVSLPDDNRQRNFCLAIPWRYALFLRKLLQLFAMEVKNAAHYPVKQEKSVIVARLIK
jgi:hypothetical protein